MIKKEYMTPEMELIKMELQAPLMDLSTPEEEYDNEDIVDL